MLRSQKCSAPARRHGCTARGGGGRRAPHAHEPSDPLGRLIASFHNYTGEACDTHSCWDATIAPVAAQVPVVTGEFGEDDCPAPAGGSPGENPANFDNRYMTWADDHGIGYMGWGWFVLESTPSET